MKRIHFAFALVGVGSCFAQSLSQIQTNGPLPGAPFNDKVVTGRPLTADGVTSTDQTLPDGTHVVSKQTTNVARDSQGRTRSEPIIAQPAGGAQQPATLFISDPVAQVSYLLRPDHTALKLPFASNQAQQFRTSWGGGPGMIRSNPQGTQQSGRFTTATAPANVGVLTSNQAGGSKTEQLGTQTIGYVQAEGSRTTLTIPAGQVGNESPIVITDERWYSQELQATVLAKHTDPRIGELTYQLTNIQRIEPLASLFLVPSDYTIESIGK